MESRSSSGEENNNKVQRRHLIWTSTCLDNIVRPTVGAIIVDSKTGCFVGPKEKCQKEKSAEKKGEKSQIDPMLIWHPMTGA